MKFILRSHDRFTVFITFILIITVFTHVPATSATTDDQVIDLDYKFKFHYELYDQEKSLNISIDREYIFTWKISEYQNLDINWFWNGIFQIHTLYNQSISNTSLTIGKNQFYQQQYNFELLIFQAVYKIVTIEFLLDIISKSLFIPPNMNEYTDRTDYKPFEMIKGLGIKSAGDVFALDQETSSEVSTSWIAFPENGSKSSTGLDVHKYTVLSGNYVDTVVTLDDVSSDYNLKIRNIVDNYYSGGVIDHFAATLSVNGTRGDSNYLTNIQYQLAKIDNDYPPLPSVHISKSTSAINFVLRNWQTIKIILLVVFVVIVAIIVKKTSGRERQRSDSIRDLQKFN